MRIIIVVRDNVVEGKLLLPLKQRGNNINNSC